MNSPSVESVLQDELLFLRLLTIKDKRGRLVPLIANRAQRHFYANRSGRDLILKARQLGFSTFIQGLFYKRVTTEFGKTAVTISHDRSSTEKLRDKFKLFYNKIPDGAKPIMGKDDKITSAFPQLESSSYIGTAGNHSFGRGNTLHLIHGSEFAFWPEPKILLTGLLEAVPDLHIMPDSWIILESTPNGAEGEFYEMCMAALEGRGEWKLHFYEWWWDDEYRMPLDRNEVLTYDPQELVLVEKHGLTPEQIKWRRFKIERLGDEFLQEYPEDPITCFLLSGRGRFDREQLRLRLDTQCADPIEERLYVGDFARWRIFEPPRPDTRYVMGCDPSEGIGENNAAAVVRDFRTNTQVATLHGQFELTEFAKYVRELAVHYNGALVAVERNNHGHTVINYLQSGTDTFPGYNALYVHRDGKVGWHTNSTTRPVMIDDLAEEYKRPELYAIRDKTIIHQALRFVVKNKRAEAGKGAYDDLVMADAIAGQMRQIPSGPSYAFGPPVPKGDVA